MPIEVHAVVVLHAATYDKWPGRCTNYTMHDSSPQPGTRRDKTVL